MHVLRLPGHQEIFGNHHRNVQRILRGRNRPMHIGRRYCCSAVWHQLRKVSIIARYLSSLHAARTQTCNTLSVVQILDEAADPGSCEILRLKGPFAMELLPKLPRKAAEEDYDPGFSRGGNDFKPPENPRVRPSILRWAGNRGVGAWGWHQHAGVLWEPGPARSGAIL